MSYGDIPGAPPGGHDLLKSGLSSAPFGQIEDVDPMANMTNMVDAMLVLAVGLMMALVVAMNVNFYDIRELLEDDLTEIENPEDIVDDIHATENPYQEMGTVYQDPTTGKTYVITDSGEQQEVGTPTNTNEESETNGDADEG